MRRSEAYCAGGHLRSYKQLGLGHAASRMGVSFARVYPVWIRSEEKDLRCKPSGIVFTPTTSAECRSGGSSYEEKMDFEVEFRIVAADG